MSIEHSHDNEHSSPLDAFPLEKIGWLPEDVASYEDQRKYVEKRLGNAISATFENNADFIIPTEGGADQLNLRVPFRQDSAPVVVTRIVDEEGRETVNMTFNDGWKNHWKYVSGPEDDPRLIPCREDPKTGEIVPIEPKSSGAFYDPTSDQEIARGGRLWVGNFENGTPELPKSRSRLKTFGRSVLSKLARH